MVIVLNPCRTSSARRFASAAPSARRQSMPSCSQKRWSSIATNAAGTCGGSESSGTISRCTT